MIQKKIRLLSTILAVSLMSGTLSASLSLNNQLIPFAQQGPKNSLKKEIDQRISDVKKVINGFNIAKIMVPAAVAGVGIVATAVIALLFFIPAIKYGKALKAFTKETKKILPKEDPKEAYRKILDAIDVLKKRLKQKDITRLETHAYKEFYRKASSEKTIKNIKTWFKKNIIADTVTAFASGAVTMALFGLSGVTSFFLLKFLGLSKKAIAKSFENVTRLEQIEKNNPGILNAQQKSIITQFKKLKKNPTVLGIIQNLHLRAALEKIVITTMKQQPSLARRVGTKKADKLFSIYIKLKWKEQTLQKTIDEYTAINLSGLNVSLTKRELSSTKKKIERLENRHPDLNKALANAVQDYAQQADNILETLKQELMKITEPKEIKLPELPVIPL